MEVVIGYDVFILGKIYIIKEERDFKFKIIGCYWL